MGDAGQLPSAAAVRVRRADGEIPQSKVSQKREGSWQVQVAVCRLLCKVSGDCQVVLGRLLDREVNYYTEREG